jgi:hypothetical protein
MAQSQEQGTAASALNAEHGQPQDTATTDTVNDESAATPRAGSTSSSPSAGSTGTGIAADETGYGESGSLPDTVAPPVAQ